MREALIYFWASQVVLVVKNPRAKAGDVRDGGSIPWSGRSPGGGHGSPLQYPCLGHPMDRGAWRTLKRILAASQWKHLSKCTLHLLGVGQFWKTSVFLDIAPEHSILRIDH